jgi:uroporphyrinogen-III decarboxylase
VGRDFFLDLARRGHRVPIAADLLLREHADAEAILEDGERLGAVIVEAARAFGTPLALPLMDLRLEKAELLRLAGVKAAEHEAFHFATPPAAAETSALLERLRDEPPGARVQARLDAVRHVARWSDLLPIAMCIGPFSLTTKLLADPIAAVYLSGAGRAASDEPAVALLGSCQELSLACVLRQLERAIDAGAGAVLVAEPAANQVYVSPRQLEQGSDVFERLVLRPNRRVAALLAERGVDLVFHCCGELATAMLDGFCSLRPAVLSLGSSRRLWDDARRVPEDVVLYGNLPSKLFYSDEAMPESRVAELAATLADRMRACGHPFILGTECDTLHVEGAAATIRAKVARMLERAPPLR